MRVERRRVLTAILLATAITASVRADMMPACHMGVTSSPMAQVGKRGSSQPSVAVNLLAAPTPASLAPPSPALVAATNGDLATANQAQPRLQTLEDDHSSFDFCLYALMGLGLWKAAPQMRRMSLGDIPDWYHHGGPLQIGHSHAVGPSCLCSAAVCFVQPDHTVDDFSPQYRIRTIVSSWLESQFAPCVHASRGPPMTS